jgi:hypothetical protein
LSEVLGTVSLEKECLGQWSNLQVGTVQQKLAYLYAERGSPGFASDYVWDLMG